MMWNNNNEATIQLRQMLFLEKPQVEVPCTYKDYTFLDDTITYVCEFTNQNIPEHVQIIPKGLHKFTQSASARGSINVVGVIFNQCWLTKVPQGLTKIFPNMKILSIWGSNLKDVNKNDLLEYRNIERIGFCNNQIEFLPGDLFEGFTNLEEIAFKGNKLNLIEPNILDGLDKLKNVNFKNNPGYTKCYSLLSGCQSNATFQEVKDELFMRFYRDHNKIDDLLEIESRNKILMNRIELFEKNVELLNHEIQVLREKNQNLQDENLKIQESASKTTKIDDSDIKNFLKTDETFKDFKIIINDREFPVHKFLIAARSPTLAELLKNNPEVEHLNLVDISVEIFEKILKFLYTDELPGDEGTNFLHLFSAAGKLKIEELKDHAAMKIINIISEENAINVLRLSNKYDHEKLKLEAFKKIKEFHPKIDFKDEWAEDFKIVIKIIDAFKMKEDAIRKVEEEFKNLIKKS